MLRALTSTVLLSLSLCAVDALAQPDASSDDVRNAYENLDFDLALTLAREITSDAESYTPSSLVDVHTIAALILIGRGDRAGARGHFVSALSLDPELQLDPASASPDVVQFFEGIRREERITDSRVVQEVRYIPVQDPRAAAAFRSMLIPGWGQLYKGQKKRGAIMMGVWGVAAAGTITAHLIRADRQDRYVSETDPALVSERFNDFNQWHKARNNLALATAIVWAASYLDALLFEVNGARSLADHPQRARLEITPPSSVSGARIGLRFPIP